MNRGILALWFVSGLVALALWNSKGFTQPELGRRDDATGLMARLLREHFYLLTTDQRVRLDEIHRRVRELGSRRVADRLTVMRETEVELGRMANDELERLRNTPWVIPVSFAGDKAETNRRVDITMPGDMGAFLLRVDSGGGKTHYATIDYDLGGIATPPIRVPLEPGDLTWVLVSLSNLPVDRSSLVLEFSRSNRPAARLPIDIRVPKHGRFKAAIVSDEGEPVPAMVQLVWKTNGRERRPSNAIDLTRQLDNRGLPYGGRRANLPGRMGGRFWWCVPGPIDMTLPPGDWEITVRRGVEFVPVQESFSVRSGETVEKTLRSTRWEDMRRRGWYSGDDHVHSQLLSPLDADNLMAWIRAEDIHLANIVKMGDINRTYFEQRGFGKQYRVAKDDYVLSPGQECPRTDDLGHTIAMNTTGMIRDADKYYLYDWVFDNVHAQGGLSGYCHVLTDLFNVHRDMSMNIAKSKVDFVEVLQFGNIGTKLYYDFLNNGFKLTASSGSDVPWGGTVGEGRLYAYIGQTPFSADAWFEAVRKGRTFVTNGPMIELHVDKAVPGDELSIPMSSGKRTVKIRARAWGDPGAVVPAKLEIIRHGEVIRSAVPAAAGQKEIAVEFEIDAGFGSWIAAHAEGTDGSHAHTTPVYVVRPPLRFWKHEEVDRLIEARLANLAEVEQIVAAARAANEKGEVEQRREVKQLALQGPELLKRVAAAREIYRSLKEQAEKERPVRSSN
jgi:hypothetical protein